MKLARENHEKIVLLVRFLIKNPSESPCIKSVRGFVHPPKFSNQDISGPIEYFLLYFFKEKFHDFTPQV